MMHESVKFVEIVGTNAMQLKSVIVVTPKSNDYSGFEGTDEHCASDASIARLL